MKPEVQLMPTPVLAKKSGFATSATNSLRTESTRDLLSFTREGSPVGVSKSAPS
jgi:hypothetical protein